MRYIASLAAALAVGLFASGYFVAPADGQIPQAPTYQVPVESLPPHPSQVVNLAAMDLQLPGGQKTPIYTVPPSHWLVLTAWNINSSSLSLLESSSGNETLRVTRCQRSSYMRPIGGPTGIVFHPGTQVVLRNDGSVDELDYTIVGYLVRR